MATISEILSLAVEHHRAGRFPAAEELYRRILHSNPQHVDATHLLGVLAHQVGKHEVAIEYIRRAIGWKGDVAAFHNNLGEAYRALRRPAEAIACYQRALQLNPEYAEALSNMGGAFTDQGSLEEAADSCRRALQLKPEFAEAHNNLGNALKDPHHLDEAIACYRRALELKADYAEAHNNLGVALREQGKLDEAVASYRRALDLRPNFAEAHNNLGNALKEQGKVDEALAGYGRALQLKPEYVEAHANRSAALYARGRLDESLTAARRALEINPRSAEAFDKLGNALKESGRLDEAAECYRRALEIKPNLSEIYFHRSLIQLLRGDYQQGWIDYEWRKLMQHGGRQSSRQPAWDGQPLPGGTILLSVEQGLGDTIQFIRYAPLVKRRVGTVVVECQQELMPLLANCAGIDRLVAQGDEPPPHDVQALLMSLPRIFKTTVETVPADVPYLAAAPALVGPWRQRLARIEGFKIGIAWQGNRQYSGDPYRSPGLAPFAALADVPGVRLVSLQKKTGLDQLERLGGRMPVVDWSRDIDETAGAFMDTAAIMTSLDLVVTSDSAVAHLAGALGVPVWVALPLVPDWRFLLDRDDSPWYPRMRLFRQKALGDWQEVFAQVRAALEPFVAAAGRPRADFAAPGPPPQPAALPPPPAEPRSDVDAAAYKRAALAVDMIPTGATVLDLGSGAAVADLLPFGARYIACDKALPSGPLPACDLAPETCPSAQDVSHIMLLGMLERVADVPVLLDRLRLYNVPVILSFSPADGGEQPRRPGWVTQFTAAQLRHLIQEAGFSVAGSLAVDRGQQIWRLSPFPQHTPSQRKVLVLSFLNTGNLGDRLGYHLINRVLPAQAVVHHAYFNAQDGYRPANIPEGKFDLLVLGTGNSLFGPLLTDELLELMDQTPQVVGIFGTQYRQYIDQRKLAAVLDRLSVWFARYEGDLLLYGKGRNGVHHLGDWLIDAFAMTRGERADETLIVGDEILQQTPLDRSIQRIQSYRRVLSTRLHPLLCAMTSAEEVAYREQRDMPLPSGKFRSMLIDVFGRTYPEEKFFAVDRDAVMAYKRRVRINIGQVRRTLAEILSVSPPPPLEGDALWSDMRVAQGRD